MHNKISVTKIHFWPKKLKPILYIYSSCFKAVLVIKKGRKINFNRDKTCLEILIQEYILNEKTQVNTSLITQYNRMATFHIDYFILLSFYNLFHLILSYLIS